MYTFIEELDLLFDEKYLLLELYKHYAKFLVCKYIPFIKIYDLLSMNLLTTFNIVGSYQSLLMYNSYIIVGYSDKITIWDLSKTLYSFNPQPPKSVDLLSGSTNCFITHHHYLISGDRFGCVKIWDLNTYNMCGEFQVSMSIDKLLIYNNYLICFTWCNTYNTFIYNIILNYPIDLSFHEIKPIKIDEISLNLCQISNCYYLHESQFDSLQDKHGIIKTLHKYKNGIIVTYSRQINIFDLEDCTCRILPTLDIINNSVLYEDKILILYDSGKIQINNLNLNTVEYIENNNVAWDMVTN
jgi:hypothetical protein